jgi:hypothetical protein
MEPNPYEAPQTMSEGPRVESREEGGRRGGGAGMKVAAAAMFFFGVCGVFMWLDLWGVSRMVLRTAPARGRVYWEHATGLVVMFVFVATVLWVAVLLWRRSRFGERRA